MAAPGGVGGLDPQAARMRQALVPVPERIWALRNVANNLVRSAAASSGGGGSEGAASQAAAAAEGISMLQQAADLAAEHYGKTHPGARVCVCLCVSGLDGGGLVASSHLQLPPPALVACSCFMVPAAAGFATPPTRVPPAARHRRLSPVVCAPAGQLSALLDYISALLLLPGHQPQARAAIEAACDVVQAVGERYRQQRDLLSLVLLFEATQAELDVPQVVGRDSAAMSRLVRQASDAFSVLDAAQASLVRLGRGCW